MQINLLSCDAPRPDRRAISKTLLEIADGMDPSLSSELADILVEGSPVEIEVSGKTIQSAYRALRKLQIDYEIMD